MGDNFFNIDLTDLKTPVQTHFFIKRLRIFQNILIMKEYAICMTNVSMF